MILYQRYTYYKMRERILFKKKGGGRASPEDYIFLFWAIFLYNCQSKLDFAFAFSCYCKLNKSVRCGWLMFLDQFLIILESQDDGTPSKTFKNLQKPSWSGFWRRMDNDCKEGFLGKDY